MTRGNFLSKTAQEMDETLTCSYRPTLAEITWFSIVLKDNYSYKPQSLPFALTKG